MDPYVSNVPLSCVPPCTCLKLSAATDTLWNCKVESPLLRLYKFAGTRERSCWHRAKLAPARLRLAHCAEISVKVPVERIKPPSEPAKNKSGLLGLTTNPC